MWGVHVRVGLSVSLMFLVACEQLAVTPVTGGNPLQTRGVLPDPSPNTPRRNRSPLDAIAPEDPPVANRGLLVYNGYPHNGAKVDSTGSSLFPGVDGATVGLGLFGYEFGVGIGSFGSQVRYSNLGIGKDGWSVAFHFAYYSTLPDATNPLLRLRFSNGSPIDFHIRTGTAEQSKGPKTLEGTKGLSGDIKVGTVEKPGGVLEIIGDSTFAVGEQLAPTQTIANRGSADFRPFHHLAVVFSPFDRTQTAANAPGMLHVYLNGQSVLAQPSLRSDLSEVVIDPNPPQELTTQFTTFDEIFLYQTSLSETEIRALRDKPKNGLARVWPTGIPVDVSDNPPFIQTRSNAASSVLGTFGVSSPRVDKEVLACLDFSNALSFTIAGWYYMPEGAPASVDLFRIDPGEDGKYFYFKLGAKDGLPYVEIPSYSIVLSAPTGATGFTGGVDQLAKYFGDTSTSHIDVVAGGDAWALQPGTWHFVAVTRDEQMIRLSIDGVVVGEKAPKFRFTFSPQDYFFVKYGEVPTAWTAAYSRALNENDLEILRSPGPRVWLDGTQAPQTVTALTGPTGATATVNVPNDYGALCQYSTATQRCEPLVRFGGTDGVGVGREDSIRFSKRWSGRVAINAPPYLHKGIGVSMNVFFEKPTKGFYPGFVRDVSDYDSPWILPWDVRADFACDGKACAVRVMYPFDEASGDRKQIEVPFPVGTWARIAVGFDGKTGKPEVAVNGKLQAGKELPILKGFEPFSLRSLAKQPTRRVRIGWDIREWWFTSEGPYDIDDIRVYARRLSGIELQTLTAGCDESICNAGSRTCIAGGRSTTTVCDLCDAESFTSLQDSDDYGARDRLCAPKKTFADICVSDGECTSGACSEGLCVLRTNAEAKTECDERQRDTRELASDRFTCGRCWDFHEEPTSAEINSDEPTAGSKIDECVWRPKYKAFDLIGGENRNGQLDGINDPNFDTATRRYRPGTSAGFDTFACDSGHAVTTTEPRFATLPDVDVNEWDHASFDRQYSPNAVFHQARVRIQSDGYRFARTRCTPAPLDGCEACRKNPALAYCTKKFVAACTESSIRMCEGEGQRANMSKGYPICERCRDNFNARRALLSEEGCLRAYSSFYEWTPNDSVWNFSHVNAMFTQRVPVVADLKTVMQLGSDPVMRKSDLFKLEKNGVGVSYSTMSQSLTPYLYDPPGYAAAYKQYVKEAGGGSLALADCVVTTSAFFQSVNDEICVANRNPNGAACPPTNPRTGEAESGDPDIYCESGYCGRRLGVCTDGGDPGANVGRRDGNESSSSGFSIGVFGVEQKNESSIKYEHDDVDSSKVQTTTNLSNKLILSVMGYAIPVPIYDFLTDIETSSDDDPQIDSHFLLFGIDVGQPEPIASCTGGKWEDGEWTDETGTCKANLDEPPSLGLPKVAACTNLAEKALGKKKFKKFHYEQTFFAGPVPITVEAGPVLEPCIKLEAGYSGDDLEAKVGFRPSIGTGVELEGAVGVAVIKAGVRATVTALEVALPVNWVFQILPEVSPSGQPLPRYSVLTRGVVAIEMDLLALSIALFAEIDLWLFSIEWELTIIELKAFTLSQELYGGPKREFVLDVEGK
jgi:hypothetical protein